MKAFGPQRLVSVVAQRNLGLDADWLNDVLLPQTRGRADSRPCRLEAVQTTCCARGYGQIGTVVVITITPGYCRLVILQAHPGLCAYDPSTSLLYHRLMYLVELKRELMRRLVDELRPAMDEGSLCALLEALEQVAEVTGLADQLRQAREDQLRLQNALWSLRASAAEDRAVETEARARRGRADRPSIRDHRSRSAAAKSHLR